MKPSLTIASVRAELRAVGMTLRKLDNEFEVHPFGDRSENNYFTTDLQDARDTGFAMARAIENATRRCQCEHLSHFALQAHDYGKRCNVADVQIVITEAGRFTVCNECLNAGHCPPWTSTETR